MGGESRRGRRRDGPAGILGAHELGAVRRRLEMPDVIDVHDGVGGQSRGGVGRGHFGGEGVRRLVGGGRLFAFRY